MVSLKDARGKVLHFPEAPKKIISLVPSTTESLFAMGCEKELVGLTRYCIHPYEKCKAKTKIGGTKNIEMERILSLKPELAFANNEENTTEIFDELERAGINVFSSFPKTIDDALQDLSDIGNIMRKSEEAAGFIRNIRAKKVGSTDSRFTFCYLIWYNPWMAVSGDCFISEMLKQVGGNNIFKSHKDRYFTTTPKEIAKRNPDRIFLSSEPFPFKQKHRHLLHEQSRMPMEKLSLIDGEMCSWHGTRMEKGLDYLRQEQRRWMR